jgi:hypothetical protein
MLCISKALRWKAFGGVGKIVEKSGLARHKRKAADERYRWVEEGKAIYDTKTVRIGYLATPLTSSLWGPAKYLQ